MTEIELAGPDDLDPIVELWVDLVEDQRDHGAHLLGATNRSVARDVLGRYIAADDLLLARDAGRIQGFVMVHIETGLFDQDTTRGVVDNIYVRPPDRDRGVGSTLLDAAENHLADQGATVIAIEVLAANTAARRLYERRGYEPHRVQLERAVENDSDTNDPQEG